MTTGDPSSTAAVPPPLSAVHRLRTPAALGVLFSIGSVLAYGANQVVARSLLSGDVPPQVGSSITLLTGTLVLLIFSLRSLRHDLRAPRRSLLWIVVAGLLASNGAFLSFVALSNAPVVVVSPIVAVSPLMTLVLAAVFLRQMERITLRTVLGSLLVIAGVVLVIFGDRL